MKRRMRLGLVLSGLALVAGLIAGVTGAVIVNRGSATIGPGATTAAWQGEDVAATTTSNQISTTGGTDAHCNTAAPDPAPPPRCDDFLLSVSTAEPRGSFTVDVSVPGVEDYDLYIFDKTGATVATSGNSNGMAETATVPCPSAAKSPYQVRIVYFTTLGGDGTKYGARATWRDQVCLGQAVPSFNDDALTFAPGTLVNAHFFGGEPQVTMERRAPWTPAANPAGIDPDRIYVDWPLSSRSNIGQLNRSLDGGDSFRLLFDPLCATRNRPNCATGGGGDTENEVNLVNGSVFFSDQEVLANEAYATSLDHGDTFVSQTPATNTSAVDRQWIAATDNAFKTPANQTIEAFFSYHSPPAAFIQAVPTDTHLPLPQTAPQLTNAGQTGQLRVDNNPLSLGHGTIYYPYRGFSPGGVYVATAPSSSYFNPASWRIAQISGASAASFPWVSIDHHGNAYATYDAGGVVFYSYSPIDVAQNNPTVGGSPGTLWSPPVRITPAKVTSAVFPENIAGDTGLLGVTYVGTTEFAGSPNDSPAKTNWDTYAAVISNAASASPVVNTGRVSHRISHHGNICTNGTTCGTTVPSQDRSLLDMIDIGFDQAGRLGVIFQDNNTASFQDNPATPDLSAFDYFAKQTTGPALLTGQTVNVTIPRNSRTDAPGDAFWPNRKYNPPAANLPALDVTGLSLGLEGTNLVAHLQLSDATIAGMQRDFTAYNAQPCAPPCQAQRLQYVVRFNTANEAYHVSFEYVPAAATRGLGGKLQASNDGVVNPASPTAIIGSAYRADAGVTVTPLLGSGEIRLSVPAATFGLAAGQELYSVTGLAMAGPTEGGDTTAAYSMRTVDASPPFDTTLTAGTTGVRLVYLRATGKKAIPAGRPVVVAWRTGEEANLLGFNVYRQVGKKQTKINRLLVPGKNKPSGSVYTLNDRLPKPLKTACYRLQLLGLDGSKTWLARTCSK